VGAETEKGDFREIDISFLNYKKIL